MAERNNHKTMRITDEAVAYIETFAGSTFNDKVNNMIDYFINTQNRYETDLRHCEEQIKRKREFLIKLREDFEKLNGEIFKITQNYKELIS